MKLQLSNDKSLLVTKNNLNTVKVTRVEDGKLIQEVKIKDDKKDNQGYFGFFESKKKDDDFAEH